jgi:CheY-like chemotaxis protein
VREPRRHVVLSVEDELANQVLLRATLGRSPSLTGALTLLEAPDLATAREIIGSGSVDLVLLDVRLPDGNGLDLVPSLKQQGVDGPAVIVLSASVLPAERERALGLGVDAFLSKPYRPAELQAAVAKVLSIAEAI